MHHYSVKAVSRASAGTVNCNLLSVDSFTLVLGREKLFCTAVDRKGRLVVAAVFLQTSKDVLCCEIIYLPMTFYLPLPFAKY